MTPHTTGIPDIVKHAREGMHKAVENTKREFSGLRGNKATTALLDTVRVDAYGSHVPLNQVGMVAAPEPRLLTVQPFDKSLANSIEKAIRDAGLGLNPATQGNLIRVPLPALWAFLVFAASFIPTVGTIIALVPPTILALLDSGVPTAAGVVIGFVLVNVAQDYLLQPRMMGTGINLSPLVVFLSVIAWAWILGPAGALLAVPLTVGAVVILEGHPLTRGIAALLRNKLEADPGVLEGPTLGAPPTSTGPQGLGSGPAAREDSEG